MRDASDGLHRAPWTGCARDGPDDLSNADNGQNGAIKRPTNVVDHEALHDRGGPDAQTLHHPDRTHQDHQHADEARDDPHDDVERASGTFPQVILTRQDLDVGGVAKVVARAQESLETPAHEHSGMVLE